jgi:uncharacterized protein YlxW (UPF0749 family)
MAPDRDDDDRDESTPRSQYAEAIALLRERQRTIARRIEDYDKRITAIEAKQTALDAMLNKGFGAIALITGAGVFIGWLISIGGNVFRYFK